MANLINGNGYANVTAQKDADLLGGLTGGVTGILPVGSKMAASIVGNAPRVSDGIILTKEGRRIQVDYGEHDDFTIPAGTAGVTAYYIIGYKLVQDSSDNQTCEQFVQASTASGTIAENTLKGGSSEVYVSLYRVIQTGLDNAIGDCLLPEFYPLATAGGEESGGDDPGDDTISGSTRTITGTKWGLAYKAVIWNNTFVFVSLTGTTSSSISTKSGWATVDYETDIKPKSNIMGYAVINVQQSVRYTWDTNGYFKIGFGRNTASGAAENISSGYVVNLNFCFPLVGR